ncbi:Lazarus 1 [Vigna unguiculata]|uniref:Lazarus 1 n=2 Tax=Vigna unguiculata TaxID=3917 RepID=A0A4D6MGR9_VIGUN|nr:Lazarus 1 [Vigna unguiculata]
MGLMGILCFSIFLFIPVESTGREGNMWLQNLGAESRGTEQKFLIGIILMVPVYALESFLSVLDSDAAFNSEIIRECYEAFALYCFERYLIACLGGEDNTIQFMESMNLTDSSIPLLKEAYAYGVVEHPFPLNLFLKDWNLGSEFYQSVKIGIVQYMILKMICAVLATILQSFGVYGEGKFEWKYG